MAFLVEAFFAAAFFVAAFFVADFFFAAFVAGAARFGSVGVDGDDAAALRADAVDRPPVSRGGPIGFLGPARRSFLASRSGLLAALALAFAVFSVARVGRPVRWVVALADPWASADDFFAAMTQPLSSSLKAPFRTTDVHTETVFGARARPLQHRSTTL